MFIHGGLHLLGYVHLLDADAKAMEMVEVRLLQKFRL
jgi:ssRNA-specific RNase YbeY (16S rRNA maturation enzyme)